MQLNDLPVWFQIVAAAFAGLFIATRAFAGFRTRRNNPEPLTFEQHTMIQISELRDQIAGINGHLDRIEERAQLLPEIKNDVEAIRDYVSRIAGGPN